MSKECQIQSPITLITSLIHCSPYLDCLKAQQNLGTPETCDSLFKGMTNQTIHVENCFFCQSESLC